MKKRAFGFVLLLAFSLTLFPGLYTLGFAQDKVTLKLAQAVDTIAFAPLYVARSKGFFAQEGIDLKTQVMESGSIAAMALVGGSVEVAVVASPELLHGVAQGLDLMALQFMSGMTQQFVARKEFVERKGVSAKSPLQDRIAALKGATIGVTRPGAASDTFARWLLKKGGVDPLKDVNMVSIGGTAPQLAGLKAAKTDAFLLSPPAGPTAEKEGYGVVLIPPEDVPEFKGFWFIGLVAKKSYVERNPAVLARGVKAVVKGNNFVLDNIEETKTIVRTFFPKIDPKIVDASVEATKPLVRRDGTMNKEIWENTIKVIFETGGLPRLLSPEEGVLWTDRFLK